MLLFIIGGQPRIRKAKVRAPSAMAAQQLPMLAALAALAASTAEPQLPVQRHVGLWTSPPQRIPTAMMFDSPIVANGDAGVTFGGPPSLTTFYASSNSFWSANQNVDARPNFQDKPGGSESYTQVRVGDFKLGVPSLNGTAVTYAAAQDLYRATVNATYTGAGCTLSHSTYIAAGDDNLAITTLTASGGACGLANITLQSGYLQGK